MSTTRQDAWTQDEDLLLAEVVLRYIREGGTQLQAFEEVGKKLTRTAAACGFRWNSTIRKQYKTGIELAKKQRKEIKRNVEMEDSIEVIESETPVSTIEQEEEVPLYRNKLAIEEILVYLKELHERAQGAHQYEESLAAYKEKVKELEKKVNKISTENLKLQKEFFTMENDYKALVEIMERARKMVVLKDEEFAQKVRFQMDKNGNLEKMDK